MTKKVLGKAQYQATRIGGVTTLAATGVFPNFNDKADFEQLPFLIFPPQFAFYFIHQDISLPALRPFTYSESIGFPKNAKSILIQDAYGAHVVAITEIVVPDPVPDTPSSADPAYCVFSAIATNKLLIARCDAILPAIYTRVFGPATFGECEKYSKDHGGT